jgi:hypothetical protein
LQPMKPDTMNDRRMIYFTMRASPSRNLNKVVLCHCK